MQTFVYSRSNPPKSDFFCGYAFIDAHIVLGQSGADEYMQHQGSPILPGEDGCYVSGVFEDNKITIGTDYIGTSKLFYYNANGYWAVSNSFNELVKYLRSAVNHLGNDVRLELQPHIVEAFCITKAFGKQLTSFCTPIAPIRFVPSDRYVEIREDELSLQPTATRPLQGYAPALKLFLDTCCSRIFTAIQHGMHVSADISGGLDSRTVLSMVLHAREESDARHAKTIVYKSLTREIDALDFSIASRISTQLGFALNETRRENTVQTRGERCRIDIWKKAALGNYSVLRLPDQTFDPIAVQIGGGGGECSRPFFKAKKHSSHVG